MYPILRTLTLDFGEMVEECALIGDVVKSRTLCDQGKLSQNGVLSTPC